MRIFDLNDANIPQVARLMARIKPDWWDDQGAIDQLRDIANTTFNVGWLLGDDERHPKGWLLCADYACYSCLSIECLGYDDNGAFAMEQQLEPLIEKAETYARAKGYRILRYMIGSADMSCHGQDLGDYWQALRDLQSHGRKHFDYFAAYGFKPAGFMPNCFGPGYHAILMVKQLV